MQSKLDLHSNLVKDLTCNDYLVSNESFTLMYHQELDMKITYPVLDQYTKYYDSEAYISHSDANTSITEKLYQLAKRRALQKKLSLLNSFKTNKKVLDLGAGTADFLVTCKKDGWQVYGVEPNEKARAIAKKKGVDLAEDLKTFLDQRFDVITLWHVLEHIPNLEETIQKLKSMLQPNGRIVIAVPNFNSYDAVYYQNFWAAYDVPRHLWHFSQKSIHSIFGAFEMKVSKILPMKYDAFYISLISEKYKHNKNRMLPAFWRGLISNLKAIRSKEYSSLIYVVKNSK